MQPALERYVNRLLGGCSVLADRPQPGGTHVIELADAVGDRWFLKRVDDIGTWQGEIRAYRRWVPALGDRAPSLRGANRRLGVIVMSAVDGAPGRPGDPELHRQAGELLRVFHQARAPRPAPEGYLPWMNERLEVWLRRHEGLLTQAETAFAREQTRRLHELSPLVQVPSHGDYRPYNWLQDDTGVVRVIDFGGARMHVWAFDLTRLYLGVWWDRSDLAAAFLAGYGRQLSEEDHAFIRRSSASQTVVSLAWGRSHGLPEVEQTARARLAELMDGHPVTSPPDATRRERVRRRLLPRSNS